MPLRLETNFSTLVNATTWRRDSPTGYGRISPMNIHHDCQTTNCKINASILELSNC